MNTTYFLNCVAGNVFKSANASPLPQDLYLGLSSTEPNLQGGNVSEPSASDYSRVSLSGKIGDPSDASGGVVSNKDPIQFPESKTNWGALKYFVVYDSLEGGHLLMYGELAFSVGIGSNTIMTIRAGDLVLSIQNPK